MSAADSAVVAAMVQFGGGFVEALGRAAYHADPENLEKLKRAYADYWREYADVATLAALRAKGGGV